MKRILIANRGEIAVRVIRAARELDIETVAVYSDVDSSALHVRLADRAVSLRGVTAKDTYLNIDKLIQAAILSGADGVHPGYGFLSENSSFASAVTREGLTFIGPSAEVIALMGDKEEARKTAEQAGVPLVPGTGAGLGIEEYRQFAARVGYPVIAKAVAGGSGRGMRVIEGEADLESKIREAEAEALAGFGNKAVFLEKFLSKPRHIEVQIFGDKFGNVVHFGERECSVQRRHQKIIEEAPAPNLHPELRARMHRAAVNLGKAVSYTNSGTVEFLVDGGTRKEDNFYFIEMNTRIQVEHPVTEQITGVDLLKLQLLVASGEKLPMTQEQITFTGHAFEFRVSAESPANMFSPATGSVLYVSRPGGLGVREDSWLEAGMKLSPYYDSLLAKLIVTGADREDAIIRARRALDEYLLEGVPTTLEFHRWFVRHESFVKGDVDVYWIKRNYKGETASPRRIVGPLRLPEAVSGEEQRNS